MARTSMVPWATLLLAQAACGWGWSWDGGGGGGGGGGGDATPPSIAITAPAHGAVIRGHRTITVSGTVAGEGVQSVTVAANGGPAVAAAVSGGGFTAQVKLADRANSLVATVAASGGSRSSSVQVSYPFVSLSSFQAAAAVIGQADANGRDVNRGGAVAADTVATPYGDPAWDGARLYLPDTGNNRVLVFDGVPATDGAGASFAIGQASLDSAAAACTGGGVTSPQTVRIAEGRLLLLDYWNNRILVFDPVPDASGASAAVAIGAPALDQRGTAACTADAIAPESMLVVGSRLVVGDAAHHRVLIWNSLPTTSGVPADVVLGQEGFDRCDANAGGLSAASLSYPTDAWSDGTRLYVADAGNNRVLGWNAIPTASHAPADFVLGQEALDQGAPALSRGGLRQPYALAGNGNQLFVADAQSNRVLVWNGLPTTTGALPDVVLGQGDFDHGAADDDNQDGVGERAPTARTLSLPSGLAVLDDALVVADGGNDRFLVFRAP